MDAARALAAAQPIAVALAAVDNTEYASFITQLHIVKIHLTINSSAQAHLSQVAAAGFALHSNFC